MRDVVGTVSELVHSERRGMGVTVKTDSLRTAAQRKRMWVRLSSSPGADTNDPSALGYKTYDA